MKKVRLKRRKAREFWLTPYMDGNSLETAIVWESDPTQEPYWKTQWGPVVHVREVVPRRRKERGDGS